MPLQKLALRPGVNREGTSLANEGGYFESDKIRFRSGYPEKIGGWVQDPGTPSLTTVNGSSVTAAPPTGSFWGVCRSLWNWVNLLGYNLLALGTNLKYYIQNGPGGSFYDVTPQRSAWSMGQQLIYPTTGSKTLRVVTSYNHGAIPGDFVIFSGSSGMGGAITAAILNSEFQIVTVTSAVEYTVTASVAANASDTYTTAAAQYLLSSGSEFYVGGVGWGAAPWGGATAPYASSTLTTAYPTVPLTTLTTAVSLTATTLTVATTAAFSATGMLLIESEFITYTGKTATTFTGCTRGATDTRYVAYGGSSLVSGASAHPAQIAVSQVETYAAINVTNTTGFLNQGTVSIGNETIFYQLNNPTTGFGFSQLLYCYRAWTGEATAHLAGDTVLQYLTPGLLGSTTSGWGSAAYTAIGTGTPLRTWSQANFGEDLVLNPQSSAIYYWANTASGVFTRAQYMGPNAVVTVKSGATVTVDSSAPFVCNLVGVSDGSRFVLAFGCNDLPANKGGIAPTTLDPMLVRWSDQEDFTVWWPEATNQAGSFRLSRGSSIRAYLQTRQEILVWTDSALYSMQYLGPPFVWGFQIMGDNISVMGPNACATANNTVYWMGLDKFYMYTGRVETLPCTLRQYVYDDINLSQSAQFFASTNEGYSEIWFFYCSADSDYIDRYVIFNHLDNVWYYGTMNRTAWLDTPLRSQPIAAAYSTPTFYATVSGNVLNVIQVTAGAIVLGMEVINDSIPVGTTISAFGTGTGDTGTYTLTNSLTISSPVLMYGDTIYPCGVLANHETGNDDGLTNPVSPITAYVQSSDFDIGDGHNFGFVWRIIPDLTFDGSTVNNPEVEFSVRPRQFPGSPYGSAANPAVTSAQNYQNQQTYVVQEFTEEVFTRIRGREMAFKVMSEGVGVAWQLGVPRIDIRPDGRR